MKQTYLVLAFLLAGAAFASAQSDPPDPFETARIRMGPLALNPSIVLANLGVDTNVFNTWTDPEEDITFTITPQADAWLRMGRARLKVHGSVGIVYFRDFVNERAANTDDSVGLEVPFTHLRPWVSFRYMDTRDRGGYEIDARVRHMQTMPSAGIDIPVSAKTTFGLSVASARFQYASDAMYLGNSLNEAFNRRADTARASFRYRFTPLTTAVVYVDRERDTFTYSTDRNADSFTVMPGLEFGSFAVLNGRAHVGYKATDLRTPDMPDFSGLVADMDLAYTLLGVTRFEVRATRNIEYSFEQREPYYLLTDIVGSVTQHLFGSWDVVARGGRQNLEYRQMTGGAGSMPAHTDRDVMYGAGVLYRLGRDVRIGFDVNQYRRRSIYEVREYRGLRYGFSVIYGQQ